MTSLDTLLAEWMPKQRWYADKGRALPSVKSELVATLRSGDPRLDLYVVYAHDDRYQVPLSFRSSASEPLAYALVGEAEDEFVYDGPSDQDVNGTWLRLMAGGGEADGVTFVGPDVHETDLPARNLHAEQSNTSLVYGDTYFLKLYRRLTDAPNPDVEVARALGENGSNVIAPALGWAEGAGSTLALLQPFVKNATDGWALALTSVRDLYAERDLHAEEVGGDFAPEAHRLGAVTAALHSDLAGALPSHMAGSDETVATAQLLRDRLAAAVRAVPELGPYAAQIEAVYEDVADAGPAFTQRIHGDLHLGQCMRTGDGWIVLDFEGEPARPLAERTTLMSPLRDVAGMLRSFSYAAAGSAILRGVTAPDDWEDRARVAFLEGYREKVDPSLLPPGEHATKQLLTVFELEKVVYELRYELNNRPDWVAIPVAGITRLLESEL